MKQVINWFEIPTTDFERAQAFYEQVFSTKLQIENLGDFKIGIFQNEGAGPTGAICHKPQLKPGENGTLIYLDAGGDVTPVLERAAASGGRIVLDKTLVRTEIGYIGMFLDTEGNLIGVHAAPSDSR